MCGIVGYVGHRKVVPLLIGGLEKLEYRGYDSAGVASINGRFDVFRAEGKLDNLRSVLREAGKLAPSLNGKEAEESVQVGIGHTRWATHGRPSETNAHPHVAGNVCVVHNGIIENYVELHQRLEKEGCTFESETDTEIAAHLINYHLECSDGDALSAIRAAIAELEGSFALVVLVLDQKDKIYVAKNATPVILGKSDGENFVASDIPAVLEYTKDILVLEDGDLAEVRADSIYLENNGKEIQRELTRITWDPITAEKGGYRHFMLKEIYEQPQVITETFRGRVNQQQGQIALDEEFSISDEDLKKIKRVCLVACGTALHAGLVLKFYLERLANLPVEVDFGSEYRYRTPFIDSSTLFVVISQSGETADTLGSLALAAERGARTLAICNVVGSSIARKAESVLYTHAGPEISVASTKAFTTQLIAGYLLALHLGRVRGVLRDEQMSSHLDNLFHLPSLVSAATGFDRQIEKIARKYGRSEDFLFLGRGLLYPIAMEGALKLKEISYVHAEGYPAGEMKHGPIALIDEDLPVVVVFGRDGQNYEKALSNLREVESRGGRIIAVTDVETDELRDLAWEVVAVGEMPPESLPIVLTVPLQLLAYHVAVYRGTDVDQPRNLAKSVTVE